MAPPFRGNTGCDVLYIEVGDTGNFDTGCDNKKLSPQSTLYSGRVFCV